MRVEFGVLESFLGSVFEPTGVDSGSLRVNFGPLEVDFWAVEGKFELW